MQCEAQGRRVEHDSYALLLTSEQHEALAEFVQVLLYGEQSAVLAFDRMANLSAPAANFRSDLLRIAADERIHHSLLENLAQQLPPPKTDSTTAAAARGFFRRIASRDHGLHLARIVALDSAVCLLVGELRRRRPLLARNPVVLAILTRIHADEARHVAIARGYSSQLTSRETRREAFIATRTRLSALLEHRADALGRLEIDCDRITRALLRVPRNLLA
jgi:rubrerythrin